MNVNKSIFLLPFCVSADLVNYAPSHLQGPRADTSGYQLPNPPQEVTVDASGNQLPNRLPPYVPLLEPQGVLPHLSGDASETETVEMNYPVTKENRYDGKSGYDDFMYDESDAAFERFNSQQKLLFQNFNVFWMKLGNFEHGHSFNPKNKIVDTYHMFNAHLSFCEEVGADRFIIVRQ